MKKVVCSFVGLVLALSFAGCVSVETRIKNQHEETRQHINESMDRQLQKPDPTKFVTPPGADEELAFYCDVIREGFTGFKSYVGDKYTEAEIEKRMNHRLAGKDTVVEQYTEVGFSEKDALAHWNQIVEDEKQNLQKTYYLKTLPNGASEAESYLIDDAGMYSLIGKSQTQGPKIIFMYPFDDFASAKARAENIYANLAKIVDHNKHWKKGELFEVEGSSFQQNLSTVWESHLVNKHTYELTGNPLKYTDQLVVTVTAYTDTVTKETHVYVNVFIVEHVIPLQ